MSDVSAVNASNPYAATPATPKTSASSELGADTFLQLLVAQLKYQDPTSPAKGTEFLAQTAQFTMVEKLTQIAEQAEASAVINRNLGAASMVGRTVSWLNPDGTTAEGTVTSARLGSAGPMLTVGDAEVAFERVTSVTDTPTEPAAATTAPAGTTETPSAPDEAPTGDQPTDGDTAV